MVVGEIICAFKKEGGREAYPFAELNFPGAFVRTVILLDKLRVFWVAEIARQLEIVIDDVREESGVFERGSAFEVEVGYGYDFANTDDGANHADVNNFAWSFRGSSWLRDRGRYAEKEYTGSEQSGVPQPPTRHWHSYE